MKRVSLDPGTPGKAQEELEAMFHEFIAHRLSERVAETGRLVDTLIG